MPDDLRERPRRPGHGRHPGSGRRRAGCVPAAGMLLRQRARDRAHRGEDRGGRAPELPETLSHGGARPEERHPHR